MNNYFTFSAGEKKYLEEINSRYDMALSPFATKNEEAIRLEDKKPRHNIIRPAYSYDVDFIIHNPFYNRYADKTQVFSFYRNDDLTRRALHVQFVSKIAKTIGRALSLNLDLIEAIALGHDMGHTPFGHKGEEYLSEAYEVNTEKDGLKKRYFNHNVHSTRIFKDILAGNLTLQTLSGILSHNGERVCKEYAPSNLKSFEEFDKIMEKCYTEPAFLKTLRPNTLEGCVVRISDMIAYAGKDRQDLYRAKLITSKKFKERRLIGTNNRDIISNIVINIIKNSINCGSLNMDEEVFDDLRDLIAENFEVIYKNEELNAPYEEGVRLLMHKLFDRLKEDLREGNTKSPIFTHYINEPNMPLKCYYDTNKKIIADKNDIVTDFIAAMTDDYFVDICEYMDIDSVALARLKYKGYF